MRGTRFWYISFSRRVQALLQALEALAIGLLVKGQGMIHLVEAEAVGHAGEPGRPGRLRGRVGRGGLRDGDRLRSSGIGGGLRRGGSGLRGGGLSGGGLGSGAAGCRAGVRDSLVLGGAAGRQRGLQRLHQGLGHGDVRAALVLAVEQGPRGEFEVAFLEQPVVEGVSLFVVADARQLFLAHTPARGGVVVEAHRDASSGPSSSCARRTSPPRSRRRKAGVRNRRWSPHTPARPEAAARPAWRARGLSTGPSEAKASRTGCRVPAAWRPCTSRGRRR